MTTKINLLEKIKDKSALIGIVGLGYVGLPLLLRFVEGGFRVIGFDIDEEKIQFLKNGKSYINHISSNLISSSRDKFEATNSFNQIHNVDVIILCVPTPLTKYREPDLSFVVQTINSCLPYIRSGQLLSLESTTYPGTTEEVIAPKIESTGLKIGKDVFIAYSPEREDPGNSQFNTRTIPKVCGGMTEACLESAIALYSSVIDKVIPVSSTKVAEMTKLLENIHRAVNIGLVNEMKIVADRMNIDIHEVIAAASTKPFGFVPYHPGPGIGGHCIPIDPFYLTWKAREYGLHTRFIELAGEINDSMPKWVVSKVIKGLNNQMKSLKSSKILILGMAYKADIDDMRESPSIHLLELLEANGAVVDYSDPYVPRFPKVRNHPHDLKSVELTPESIKMYDCIILATTHSKFDYEMIKSNAKLIVDTRGFYKGTHPNILRA